MTYKEALEILYKGIAPNPTANNECINLCKTAIEKQIPKKPEKNEYNYFICPCCNSDDYSLMHDSNYADRYNYCHNCGQALDWGDTK